MKRYFHALAYSLGAILASYVLFAFTALVCHWFYEALIEWFPSVFKDYSPVLNAEEYSRADLITTMLGSALAIILANVLLTRFDNGRDEFIIAKTEGFYKIPEILPFYYKTYLLPDLVAALFSSALISALIITARSLEFETVSRLSNLVNTFEGFHLGVFFKEWGVVIAPLCIFVFTFLSKILSAPHALKKWRAAWLTYN